MPPNYRLKLTAPLPFTHWARSLAGALASLKEQMIMEKNTRYNIIDATYDEFIAFLFDHEVIPIPEDIQSGGPEPWHWHAEVEFNPMSVINYYTKLFCEPIFLLHRYSREELEQGLWVIRSPNLACSVANIIWNEEIPFEIRANCVRSMYELYKLLFSQELFEESSSIWWDSLAYDWHCENRVRENGGEDELMQDVMFDTLTNILYLESIKCQFAALHGLGHLHHPKTEEAITKYLQHRPNVNEEIREYALAAMRFDIL